MSNGNRNYKDALNGKTILVTGGTGSFGHQVVERILETTNPKEIIIFSRDEKKQFDMRNEFQNDKLTFIIGDVRNKDSVLKVMRRDVDYVFHAAALKQVPSCEFFPMEAVKTNIIGTDNVLTAAIEEGSVMSILGMCALLISALLTAVYMLTPAFNAYFPPKDFDFESISDCQDPTFRMKVPFIVFTILVIVLGLNSSIIMELLNKIATGAL